MDRGEREESGGGGGDRGSEEKEAFYSCLEDQETDEEVGRALRSGDDSCGRADDDDDDGDADTSSSEDDDDADDDDDDDVHQASTSLGDMCFSPPKNVRKIKRDKNKMRSAKSSKSSHRSKTKSSGSKQQRPQLINSAENIISNEDQALNSSLSDRLNELSERRQLDDLVASSSVSAPPTANIIHHSNSPSLNRMETSLAAGAGSYASKAAGKRNNADFDPFDRAETQKKIMNLLQLALKSNNSSSTNPTLLKKQKQSNLFTAAGLGNIAPTKSVSATTCLDSSSSSSSAAAFATSAATAAAATAMIDELTHRRHVNTCIWKEIYDFFEHFTDRSRSMAEIDARLFHVRTKIKFKIDLIQATSFGFIKTEMNRELSSCIRSPIEYSTLYERKPYIDQLCYLYWLVEDLINEIGKIESLYPSIEALKADQPCYADQAFQSTIKTLTLWYKLISQLMNKSDIMGRFLGFAKNKEYKEHWTWFEQRLSYSKNEYETVQKWLNENVESQLQQQLSGGSNGGNGNGSCNTTILSEPSSGKESNATLMSPSPSIEVTKPSSNNLAEMGKIDRQISFALRATSSSVNLLYNNFGGGSNNTNYSENSESTSAMQGSEAGATTINSSMISNVSTSSYMNDLEVGGSVPTGGLAPPNTQTPLNPEHLAAELLKQTAPDSEHLKSAKLYHLSSFIASRSSSVCTAGSLSPISPSIYKTLMGGGDDSSNEHSKADSTGHEENKVIFTINHNGNDPVSKYPGPPSKQSSVEGENPHPPPPPTPQPNHLNATSHMSYFHPTSTHLPPYHAPTQSSGQQSSPPIQPTPPQQQFGVGQDPNKIREKILSEFLRKRLRKCGLTQTFKEIRQVLLDTLFNALQALQIDRCERYTLTGCDDHFYYHLMPLHHKCKEFISKYTLDEETIQYGVKCDTYKRLDLPTFRPLYLHLCSVLLELMHLCIRMQIENNRMLKMCETSTTTSSASFSSVAGTCGLGASLNVGANRGGGGNSGAEFKFSLLSTEVLTTECRECIEQAIIVRQLYYHMIYSVFDRSEMDVQTLLEHDLLKFDDDLKEIINIYLNFITNWVQDLVKQSDLSKALWVLSDEWAFCKNNLYYVTASEDIYAKRFCTMSTYINGSILSFLSIMDSTYKQPLMEYISRVENTQDNIDEFDSAGGGGNSLMHEQQPQDDKKDDIAPTQNGTNSEEDDEDEEYDEDDEEEEEEEEEVEEENINIKCNEFKEEINRMKKYSMKALGFCSKLINDLELAARYEVKSSIQELLDELKSSGHVLINFTNPELNWASYSTTPESSTSSFDHLMGGEGAVTAPFMIFVPHEFYKEKLLIIRLLFIISEKDEFDYQQQQQQSGSRKQLDQPEIIGGGFDQHEKRLNTSLDSSPLTRNLFNDTVFRKGGGAAANSAASGTTDASPPLYYHQHSHHYHYPTTAPNSNENQSQQRQRSPGLSVTSFRRLSSSNSFVEMGSDNQAKVYLSKLSKLANLGRIEDNPITPSGNRSGLASPTSHAFPTDPVSAFIISPSTRTKTDGYLLYLQLAKSSSAASKQAYKWTGPTTSLYASIPVRNSLYKHKSTMNAASSPKLILVTPKQAILKEKRIELKQKLKGTISLVKEKTSFHPNIEYAIDELVESILSLRKDAIECIKSIERDLKMSVNHHHHHHHHHHGSDVDRNSLSHSFVSHPAIDQRYLSELWRVSYNFGIELQNECMKFMTQDKAELFAAGLADFSVMWCEYIVSKTERGKGRTMRPWAANKGIQLIQEAVAHSTHLKDEDFVRLIESVQKCIIHVIGDRNTPSSSSASNPPSAGILASNHSRNQSQTDIPYHIGFGGHHHHYHAPTSSHQLHHTSSSKVSHSLSESTMRDVDLNDAHARQSGSQLVESRTQTTIGGEYTRSSSISSQRRGTGSGSGAPPPVVRVAPRLRFSESCLKADRMREDVLFKKRYIGKILDTKNNMASHIFATTEVSFRWQLGLLIGEGQFGKVYSCVNLDTGEPMALKKIQFRSNDVVHVKMIADEINNMQGIQHDNLVKIYGAELHRKEILIFMEFCGDQSTLNRISRESSGLPEKIVRDYTKSLLKAVECLHENNIMHRDIKGANIFLKPVDAYHPEKTILKLGDFGCSIKFKDPVDPSNKERATGFMGTFAFMAPEVMSSGNGSMDSKYDMLADIWSVGCVVIEMFTGKHPWHPLTDEKILYTVFIEAKTKKPPYPSGISQEAQNFLDNCLAYESKNRLTADKLLDHSFVKVLIHEEQLYSSSIS